MLIFDEVQCGFGRTGKMFAWENSGVVPDILVMAKGLANGMPLSAIVSSKAIMDTQAPGSMGGTYAGNVVACAAAHAVLKTFKEENVLANVISRSVQFKQRLEKMVARYNFPVEQIRVNGLMIGIQFSPVVPKGTASDIAKAALKHKLMILNTSKYEVLRLIPALNISAEEAEEGLARFERALCDVFNAK